MQKINKGLHILFCLFVAYCILLANLKVCPTLGAAEKEKGLVGYWKFDENKGESAKDSSGNRNDGTLIGGATWAEGISGSCIKLNGEDAYIEVQDNESLNPEQELTVEAWVKIPAAGWDCGLMERGNYYCWIGRGGTISLALIIDGGFQTEYSASVLNDDKWHHWAGVYDGESIKIYVDGKLDITKMGISGSISSTSANLTIGFKLLPGVRQYFPGLIDELKIYSRALKPDEVKERYDKNKPVIKSEIKEEKKIVKEVKKEKPSPPSKETKTMKPSGEKYTLSNGYFFLSGQGGIIYELKFDPTGKSNYGENLVKGFYFGTPLSSEMGLKIKPVLGKNSLTLEGNFGTSADISIPKPQTPAEPNYAAKLEPGHTLGQSFNLTGEVYKVGGWFPNWITTGAGMTLTLKKDGPDGEIIASKQCENVENNSFQCLTFSPQPPGKYYLEISEPVGTIGWWSKHEDLYKEGEAYSDGNPESGNDRTFQCFQSVSFPGKWTILLKDNRLESKFIVDPKDEAMVGGAGFQLVTPWVKDGYIKDGDHIIKEGNKLKKVSPALFTRFYSERGQYESIEAYKRLNSDFSINFRGTWVYATGTGNYDIKFYLYGLSLNFEMDNSSMTFKFGKKLSIEVLLHTTEMPDYYPVYFSSDPQFDETLNRFLYERAYCVPDGAIVWAEWMAIAKAWANTPRLLDIKNNLIKALDPGQMDKDGYVWCWFGHPGWPVGDYKNVDTRHFDSNPSVILGAWRYYIWTHDEKFLKENIEQLRKAMDYQLKVMNGEKGVIVISSPVHRGLAGDEPSNYWDWLPFGYKDAHCNTYYYPSLQAMAELEMAMGNHERAKYLMNLMPVVKKSFNDNFWNEKKGRYAGCVNINNEKIDYGFTWINLQAMAYGLADEKQVKRVYNWMENEPNASGKPDTYLRWKIAPRSCTEKVTTWIAVWFKEISYDGPDANCEEGGAILYTSYYDIMARVKYLGADNAFKRFQEILNRYNEPDKLCGGNPFFYGESGQRNCSGQLGTWGEFPESGMVPASFLYAFLGIDANIDGLVIKPNLPSYFKFAGVRNLNYRGLPLEVKIARLEPSGSSINIICKKKNYEFEISKTIKSGESFILKELPDGKKIPEISELEVASRWKAQWIWYPENPEVDCDRQSRYFRKIIEISQGLQKAQISVAADNDYILYINGQEVMKWGNWIPAKTLDITSFLHSGKNIIAAEVFNGGGPAGLLLETELEYEGNKKSLIISDTSFKSSREKKDNWLKMEFNDSSWANAKSFGKPPIEPWGEIEIETDEW